MSALAAHAESAPALVWLRHDLRLADQPAVRAATLSRRPVMFFYVLDDETPGPWKLGGASRWWLHHSLAALKTDIEQRGGALLLRRGVARKAVPEIAREAGAASVSWCRAYEPHARADEAAVSTALSETGVEAQGFSGALLFEPEELKVDGFKVFSAFWRAAQKAGLGRAPTPAPKTFKTPDQIPPSDELADWALLPTKPDWAAGFSPLWRPGEAGARERLKAFLKSSLSDYADKRDLPAEDGSSRLSPHLHFGEISPHQIIAACAESQAVKACEKFQSELGWRDFSYHLLYHSPNLPEKAWRPAFDKFPWRKDENALRAWRRGRTGYPMVDAGMRELWATGFMHNRVRMIAASFLIKHLLIDWRAGERWFWDTLVDADLANNSASWQWVAGSGADAAPYFRIFNPVSQGEKFDPDGAYVRRWIPELALMPREFIHKPWEAPPLVLNAAGVTLGQTYPAPIVDHAKARARALEAFEKVRG